MKLLMVAGDLDGWRHLDAVARALPEDSTEVLAICGPGLPPIARTRAAGVDGDEARRFDAALLATARTGPDPLTRAVAGRCAGVPVHVIQEYWGDTLGAAPAAGASLRYLVRDELAAKLTATRAPDATVGVVGSPKYAAFERHDILAARRARREELGAREGDRLVGWFGQAPLAEAGYRRTLAAFAEAVAARGDAKVLYRPHPREPVEQAAWAVDAFRRAGVGACLALAGETWQWLAAVDGVFACFSNCCADAVQLNRVAPRPLNASAYMLFDAELQRHHERATAMKEPPLASRGLVLQAREAAAIAEVIAEALDRAAAERQWSAARRMLPLGSVAAAAVAREIGTGRASPRIGARAGERT